MSGTHIVGTLLREYAELQLLVPADRIKAGALPQGVQLAALLVRTVSIVERQPLKHGATVFVTARISVAVRAASYRDQVAIIRLVRRCCRGRTGEIAGFRSVSILTAGTGPDMRGSGDSYEQTQDFRVSFEEPA